MSDEEQHQLRDRWLQLPAPYGSAEEFARGIGATLAHRRGDLELALQGVAEQGEEPSAVGFVEAAAGEMLIYHGRYTEGLQLLERWNEFSFSAAVPDVGNQAIILSCYAWAKIGRGDLAGADAMADQAVEIMRDARADDRPFATVPVVPLAWVAWERGDLDTAEALITSSDGPDHPPRGDPRLRLRPHLAGPHPPLPRPPPRRPGPSIPPPSPPDGSPLTGHFATLITLERTRLALLNQDLPAAERALPDWRTRRDHGAAHHVRTPPADATHHRLWRRPRTAPRPAPHGPRCHPSRPHRTAQTPRPAVTP